MLPWTCLVWNLIYHILSVPNLEVSHAKIYVRFQWTLQTVCSTIPSQYIPKIIFIQKDYHIYFDIEQKRPLLLARSVCPVTTVKKPWILPKPIWGRQDPGCPHVGPMNFAIWDAILSHIPTLFSLMIIFYNANWHQRVKNHVEKILCQSWIKKSLVFFTKVAIDLNCFSFHPFKSGKQKIGHIKKHFLYKNGIFHASCFALKYLTFELFYNHTWFVRGERCLISENISKLVLTDVYKSTKCLETSLQDGVWSWK